MDLMYKSTRNNEERVTASEAILKGLANDGGLYAPEQIPSLQVSLEDLTKMSYQEIAYVVMKEFLTDFTEEELKHCINSAYDKKFDIPEIAAMHEADGAHFLELFHGATIAFKDMALSILPYLLTTSAKKNHVKNEIVILTATSGDTGKAALEGFADVEGTQIIVFYPSEGVSDIQKRQMITQMGKNVKVFGIEGNFDDAQRGVKEIFGNKVLSDELAKNGFTFSSANSINWGRLVPQIVYYFSAYVDAVAAGKISFGDKVNFVVPTGNFGDILAGYYAKLMGLPVERLLCASNSNKVLTDFINSGTYDKRREFFKTISPSMDILVSSNLERLLYNVTDEDAALVAGYMKRLNTEGVYQIDNDVLKRVQTEFFGAWVDELETKEAIGRIYGDYKYLMDTHTAVAWRALEKYRFLTSDDTYSIVLSTASPYKFADSVLDALDDTQPAGADPFANLAELNAKTGTEIPPRMLALKDLPVLHTEIISSDKMELAVVKNLL